MECIRWKPVVWTLVVVMVFVVSHVKSDQDCQSIPYSDITEAAYLSRAVYEKDSDEPSEDYKADLRPNDQLNLGAHRRIDTAQPTLMWKVVDVVRTKKKIFKNLTFNEPLKVLVAKSGSNIAVVFMGTDKKRQLVMQGVRGATPKNAFKVGRESVPVMAYFLAAFEQLFPEIQKLVKPDKTGKTKYLISGHSLGGALATLYALKMTEDGGNLWKNKQSVLITFGAPRVGGKRFALFHDEKIRPTRKLRLIFNQDPVPHIPSLKYMHSSREIWIKSNANAKANAALAELKVCPNRRDKKNNPKESDECANQWTWENIKTKKSDHDMEGYLMILRQITIQKRKLDLFESELRSACSTDIIEPVPE